jgi:hypothetical protein
LIAGAILGWFSAVLAGVYLGVVSIYALSILAFSLYLGARERSLLLGAWLPLIYVTIHLGAGVGQLWEAVRGQRIKAKLESKGISRFGGTEEGPDAARHEWFKAA